MATISRLYKDYDTGARVVAELERSGIPHTDISIIANNDSGWFDRTDRSGSIGMPTVPMTGPKARRQAPGSARRSAVSRACLPVLASWPFRASAR